MAEDEVLPALAGHSASRVMSHLKRPVLFSADHWFQRACPVIARVVGALPLRPRCRDQLAPATRYAHAVEQYHVHILRADGGQARDEQGAGLGPCKTGPRLCGAYSS